MKKRPGNFSSVEKRTGKSLIKILSNEYVNFLKIARLNLFVILAEKAREMNWENFEKDESRMNPKT